MYTLIIAFYLSALGIFAMILIKRHEVVAGRLSVVSRLGRGSDKFFHEIATLTRRVASYGNKKSLIALTQWIAYHVLYHVREVYVELKERALSNPHSRKVIDAVRGRGEIQTSGASFYLKRISENQ